MKRGLVLTAFWVLATVAGLAQEATKSPGLSYLLDDAVRIYVVDESRCGASPDSKEGGRWYLIEGEEQLARLREGLANVPDQEESGCLCGGPDLHFYAELPDGTTRYVGLDCRSVLEGRELPPALREMMIPSDAGFVGVPGGHAYLVDIPLDRDELSARKAFSEAGYKLVVGGWWNAFTRAYPREFSARLHTERTAQAHLEFDLGTFRTTLPPAPQCPPNPKRLEFREFMQTEEGKRFRKEDLAWRQKARAETDALAARKAEEWVRRLGLEPLLVLLETPREGGIGDAESQYSCECFLRDAKAVRNILAKTKIRGTAPPSTKVEYRSAATQRIKGFYQAALLFPTAPSRKDIAKAKAVLPGIGRVIPLCECKDKPRI